MSSATVVLRKKSATCVLTAFQRRRAGQECRSSQAGRPSRQRRSAEIASNGSTTRSRVSRPGVGGEPEPAPWPGAEARIRSRVRRWSVFER